MTIQKLQEIVKESEQRFFEFVINCFQDDEFYKESYLVIQFINPLVQVPVSAAFSGFKSWEKLRETIVSNENGKEFIKYSDEYFNKKDVSQKENEIKEKIIMELFSKIEISDFRIEVRYTTLNIEKIKDLEFYLHKRGIKQNLKKSSIRTVLYPDNS